jgi:hypothetical protein
MPESKKSDRKGIFLISGLGAFIAGLCCLTPIVLILLGLATISAAAGLGNMLYGDYKWIFRLVALAFLVLALVIYFRRQGICTLDEAKRARNRILNTSLLVLIFGVGLYIVWTYIVVQYLGIAAGLPWAQYDESWAIPASIVVLGAGFAFYLLVYRRRVAQESAPARHGSK